MGNIVLNQVFKGVPATNVLYIVNSSKQNWYLYEMVELEFWFSIHKWSYTDELQDLYNFFHPLSFYYWVKWKMENIV